MTPYEAAMPVWNADRALAEAHNPEEAFPSAGDLAPIAQPSPGA